MSKSSSFTGAHSRMEGWLIKKKSSHSRKKFFGADKMRWFKLQEVNGTDLRELALCYFDSPKDKEPKGWVFVKDIQEIYDTHNSFTIVSPARTLKMETETPHDQSSWLKALLECCSNANISRVFSISTDFLPKRMHSSDDVKSETEERTGAAADAQEEGAKIGWSGLEDAESSLVDKHFDRSASLFSRHANDDSNSSSSSFYNPTSGLPSSHDLTVEEGKIDRVVSADELYIGPIKEESELLEELRSSHDPIRGGRGIRSQRTEDHRMMRGSVAGTAASTSHRLHRFIARDDAPSRPVHRSQESITGAIEETDVDGSAGLSVNKEKEFKGKDNVDEINLAVDETSRSRAQIRDQRRRQLRTHRSKQEHNNNIDIGDKCSDEGDDDDSASSDDARRILNKKNIIDAKAERSTDPPRKARDMVDEEFRASAIGPKQQPMDEFTRRPSDSKQTPPDDGLNESMSDEDIDFKAELRKYDQRSSDRSSADPQCTSTSRPPRPPGGVPPYSLNMSSNPYTASAVAVLGGTRRTNTPPRMASDPGSKADSNFVSADWDDDSYDQHAADPKHRRIVKPFPYGPTSRDMKQVDTESHNAARSGGLTVAPGVQADPNWLDEDFDDRFYQNPKIFSR